MKPNQKLTKISQVLGRICSTISREVKSGRGHRGYQAGQACVKATERAQSSRKAWRISSCVCPKMAFTLGCNGALNKLRISYRSVMNRFTCTAMWTRLRVADYKRICAAKRPDAGGVCLGRIVADRSPIGARLSNAPSTLRRASKWATGWAIRSFGRVTSKP